MALPFTIGAVGAAAAAAAGLGYLALRRFSLSILRTRRRRSDRTAASLGLDTTSFELTTADGILRGWHVRGGPGPRTTIIFAHGWHANAGEMLLWAEPLVQAGHNAIVYDALGHGESDITEYTSLHHLRQDLRAVVAWARQRDDATPGLILFGHSMGGAAAILAAEDAPEIKALIVAGAPVDPLEITKEWLDQRKLPGRFLVAAMGHIWQSVIRTPYAMLRPVERIRFLRLPILVLHGAADRRVGKHHGEGLAAANAGAELHIFEGGDHYNLPADRSYPDLVTGFVERVRGIGGGPVAAGER
ncbi:MAG TPA: alpha/beta fold hydrolase [Gemmatimonadaceae bacterium]|nr:alpha/beta fold hydrolase [Gemmatimonadaceae bacterium]